MQGRTQRNKKTGGSSLWCLEGSALLYREWSGFPQKCGPLMHSTPTVQKQPQLWLQVIEKPRNLGVRTGKKEEKGGTQLHRAIEGRGIKKEEKSAWIWRRADVSLMRGVESHYAHTLNHAFTVTHIVQCELLCYWSIESWCANQHILYFNLYPCKPAIWSTKLPVFRSSVWCGMPACTRLTMCSLKSLLTVWASNNKMASLALVWVRLRGCTRHKWASWEHTVVQECMEAVQFFQNWSECRQRV